VDGIQSSDIEAVTAFIDATVAEHTVSDDVFDGDMDC
jgi:hypothetical protein